MKNRYKILIIVVLTNFLIAESDLEKQNKLEILKKDDQQTILKIKDKNISLKEKEVNKEKEIIKQKNIKAEIKRK